MRPYISPLPHLKPKISLFACVILLAIFISTILPILGKYRLRADLGDSIVIITAQDHLRLPSTGRCLVTFEAQTTNDIHVSFNKDSSQIEGRDGMSDRAPNYEIVLGGAHRAMIEMLTSGITFRVDE